MILRRWWEEEEEKEEEHGMQSKTRTHTSESGGKNIFSGPELPKNARWTGASAIGRNVFVIGVMVLNILGGNKVF